MDPVSAETIEQAWMRQSEMDEEETQLLVAKFLEEQPYIAAYLFAADKELGEESSDAQLIPLATLVWEVFTSGSPATPMVESEDLTAAEERNIKLLESANENSESSLAEFAQQWFTEYNQRPLLHFVLEVLMSGHEEDPESAPSHIGLELLCIKTVIDCLDEVA